MAVQQPRGAPQELPGAPAIIYHLPVCSGTPPVARWAHAASCVGPYLYVYGGVGPSVLDDLAVLDVELMVWRSLAPSAARPKDRPDKLHAAAMCALGSSLWMFGGQQGRKHLRTLYTLNTEVLAWKLVTPEGTQPAAREGHTLTAVPSSGLAYLFGGQGKKLCNDMFVLKPNGAEWVELKPAGRPPAPRSGHSMVWDGGDRLVCFGGATAGATDNGLFVYSISANAWTQQAAAGTAPSPRTHHSAVLLGPGTLLVFGGCSAAGVFYNDAYTLDLTTWTWARAQPLSPPPPPRYHHSCHVVGGKVVLFGGVNPKQAFDGVVLLQTSSGCRELNAVADELARMTAGGSAAPTTPAGGAPTAAASSSGAVAAAGTGAALPAVVGDLMKLQLRDLLVKRNMEELHITAQQKAEAVEGQLKQESAEKLALQKEVLQLQLIKEEAEAAVKQLREQLADATRALAREGAEHQATSAALSDLRSSLESREQQLAEARQLLDSMSAELGILASRLHRLQQERDALWAARQQERAARREQQQQQGLSQQSLPQSPQLQMLRQQSPCQTVLTGAAAAAAQLQLQLQGGAGGGFGSGGGGASSSSAAAAFGGAGEPSYAGDDHSTVDSTSFVDCISTSVEGAQPTLQQQAQQPELLLPLARAGPGSSRGSSPQALPAADAVLESGNPGEPPSSEEQLALCVHGQLGAACLLCMCQRFLEATAGSCSHLPAGSSLAAAAARLDSSSSGGNAGPSGSGGDATAAAAAAAAGAAGPPSGSAAAAAAAAAAGSEAVQYRQYLSISELARNRLEAENAALQQTVAELTVQVGHQQRALRVMQAHPAALTACSIEELTALEGTLEASTKAVRQVVLARSIAEYQAQASAESLRCAVCMEARRSLAFGCGHQTCDKCGDKISVCPFCRQGITAKIRLFE